jgi:hypothetical protein
MFIELFFASAIQQVTAPLRYFDGDWVCEGHFIPSDRPLASSMIFRADAAGAVRKAHRDLSPGRYTAEEVWAAAPQGGFRAMILSGPATMRWFTSVGWEGNRWTWSRHAAEGEPEERFVYVRTSALQMDVEWWMIRSGSLEMGDILHCRKAM